MDDQRMEWIVEEIFDESYDEECSSSSGNSSDEYEYNWIQSNCSIIDIFAKIEYGDYESSSDEDRWTPRALRRFKKREMANNECHSDRFTPRALR